MNYSVEQVETAIRATLQDDQFFTDLKTEYISIKEKSIKEIITGMSGNYPVISIYYTGDPRGGSIIRQGHGSVNYKRRGNFEIFIACKDYTKPAAADAQAKACLEQLHKTLIYQNFGLRALDPAEFAGEQGIVIPDNQDISAYLLTISCSWVMSNQLRS